MPGQYSFSNPRRRTRSVSEHLAPPTYTIERPVSSYARQAGRPNFEELLRADDRTVRAQALQPYQARDPRYEDSYISYRRSDEYSDYEDYTQASGSIYRHPDYASSMSSSDSDCSDCGKHTSRRATRTKRKTSKKLPLADRMSVAFAEWVIGARPGPPGWMQRQIDSKPKHKHRSHRHSRGHSHSSKHRYESESEEEYETTTHKVIDSHGRTVKMPTSGAPFYVRGADGSMQPAYILPVAQTQGRPRVHSGTSSRMSSAYSSEVEEEPKRIRQFPSVDPFQYQVDENRMWKRTEEKKREYA
jgi:hypothetical protein